MREHQAGLPTFIVIGEQKCGTGWIRDRLMEHPSVFMAPNEINFFNRKDLFGRGIDFYAENFKGATQACIGEKSPEYFWLNSGLSIYNQDIFTLIQDTVPEAKIILALRSPVTRAISALQHHANYRGRRIHPGILRKHTVSEILLSEQFELGPLGILERGFYSERLKAAMDIFGDRLHTLIMERDIIADPDAGMRKICEHIGAEPFNGFSLRSNAKSGKPSYPAMLASYYLPKAQPIIQRLDRGAPFRVNVSTSCKAALWELYQADVASVAELLNEDLDIWAH